MGQNTVRSYALLDILGEIYFFSILFKKLFIRHNFEDLEVNRTITFISTEGNGV